MLRRILCGSAVLFVCCGAAVASTVSSVEVLEVTDGNAPNVANDTSMGGNVTVGGVGLSAAEQNADGTARVVATTGGVGGIKRSKAQASFAQTETNMLRTAQDYTLSFALAEQKAEVFGLQQDFGTLPINPLSFPAPALQTNPSRLPVYTAASFSYQVTVNGVVKFNARADILVDPRLDTIGLGPEILFDNVAEFDPRATENSFGGVDWITFTVDALAGEIPLGTYASGESFDVKSTLTAEAFSQSVNYVTVFDLTPLSQLGTISSVEHVPAPAPVPLPAAAWLLFAGLGGLAAIGRQKRLS